MKKVVLILSILFLFGCSNSKTKYSDELELLAKYPHDSESFTQGFFFYNNKLYETSGLYGKSKLMKNVSLEDSSNEKEYKFDDSLFAEGATVFKDKLYVLTWKEHKILVFNKDTLELEKELKYENEGWGLTTDGDFLIASDGSNKLYYLDEEANMIKTVTIEDVYYLNELEYIRGEIWANVYMSDRIVVINPVNKTVSKTLNFENLYEKPEDVNSVLNGIAFNDNKIYITGKNWDTIFVFKQRK